MNYRLGRWPRFRSGCIAEVVGLGTSARTRSVATVFVAAMLAAPTAPAFAEGPGWSASATVKKLVVTADGGVNVRLFPDLNTCVSQSGYGANYASVYPTHPGINRIKADLLAAYLTGNPVSLYFTDNTCRVSEIILGGW